MNPNREKILQDVIELVARTFSTDTAALSDETTAMDVDGWDSVSHVRFVIAVEKHFEIRFNIVEVLKARNLGDLADLIASMT